MRRDTADRPHSPPLRGPHNKTLFIFSQNFCENQNIPIYSHQNQPLISLRIKHRKHTNLMILRRLYWCCPCFRSAAPAPVLLPPWPPPQPQWPQVWSREWRPRGAGQLLWLRVAGVPGRPPRPQPEPQGVSGRGLLLARDVPAPSSAAHDPPRAPGPLCWPRLSVPPGARVPRPPWSPRAPHGRRLWRPDARQPHTSLWWSPSPASWRWATLQFNVHSQVLHKI